MSVQEKMAAIADAIRDKTGGTDKLGLDAMASGVGQVYESGRKTEYDRFWDAFQNNGNRTHYDKAFAYGDWTDESYDPKYDILCKGNEAARNVFNNCQKLSSTKVPIRCSNTALSWTFRYCYQLKTIPLLTLEGITGINIPFGDCQSLEDITIEGEIPFNFDISQSPKLSVASVQSIVDALKDLTGQTGRTLTFHADVGAKLSDEQKATVTARNWTLVY